VFLLGTRKSDGGHVILEYSDLLGDTILIVFLVGFLIYFFYTNN